MKSKVWAQLVADVFNADIEISDTDESGARGIALMAGVSAGIYKNIEDAISKCVSIERIISPNPDRVNLFKNRYAHYRDEAKRVIKI